MKKKTVGSVAFVALAAAVVSVCLLKAISREAVYPVEKAKVFFQRNIWTRVTGFFRGSSAEAENARLRRQIETLVLAGQDTERIWAENVRLRETLGYQTRQKGRWIAAEVLSRGGGAAAAAAVLRVGKGSLAGVREGAPVCAAAGVVGRVTAVSPHTAEVTLVTDRTIEVACTIQMPDEKAARRGILSGGTSEMLVIRNLKGTADVPPHSRVVTSGLGGVFPRGIEVGTYIGASGEGAEASASEGEVQPSVDFSTLEDVFIRGEG